MTIEKPPLLLFRKIADITSEISKTGVEKIGAKGLSFNYQSWEHILCLMSDIFAKYRIIPQIVFAAPHHREERGSGKQFYIETSCTITLWDAESGESFLFGPFFDASAVPGDRTLSAAESYAMKKAYCAIFTIPTSASEMEAREPAPSKSTLKPIPDTLPALVKSNIPARFDLAKLEKIGVDAEKKAILSRLDWVNPADENNSNMKSFLAAIEKRGGVAKEIAQKATVFFATSVTTDTVGEVALIGMFQNYLNRK